MRTINIVIGSILMAVLVVGVHSLIQFVFTKEIASFLEMRKIILFLLVFISCFGLSKREENKE